LKELKIENEQRIDGLNANPFCTYPTSDGYTWTLTTRLGQILHLAEERFGERDSSYTLLGIEFVADGPRIWYPGNCGHIAIQLSLDALNDEILACHQLAHEVIHLLSPTGTSYTTMLEEGLATYYARLYLQEYFGCSDDFLDILASDAPKYESACSLVRALLDIDDQAIKKLRAVQPSLSMIDRESIMSRYPTLRTDIGHLLAASFNDSQSSLA